MGLFAACRANRVIPFYIELRARADFGGLRLLFALDSKAGAFLHFFQFLHTFLFVAHLERKFRDVPVQAILAGGRDNFWRDSSSDRPLPLQAL